MIPILLIHGSFHDEHCWRMLTPHLQHHGFDVHTLTLRGHGTRYCNPYRVSMTTYADDVCAHT